MRQEQPGPLFGLPAGPAARVEDRAANVRIRRTRAHRVGNKVFVQIETNVKVTGWGEVSALEPAAAEALTRSLFELLDGENPTRVEHLWQKLYRAHRDMRGGALMVHTIAGLDIALWDIVGKLHGVPIYRLLGGPTRDRIRVYHTPKAIKVPNPGFFEHSSSPADVQRVVRSIRSARERVGPDGAVMFDAHSALPPATLIQVAHAIEPYDVLFIEEPAVPGNVEVFKRIKAAVRVPLAAGERDRTIWEMIPYLQQGCLDILQPDCCHTGGITSMKKIATLAEAYTVPLAPHCTASSLGISASLHVAASVPHLLIHEFYPDNHGFNPKGVTRAPWSVGADGHVALLPGPGLGVEVDEKLMERESRKRPGYRWPGARLKDGSVADY